MPVTERVNLIGVELEGGWVSRPRGSVSDGSVSINGSPMRVIPGELPSPPMLFADVGPWMLEHYPDAVNHTCGLHVHTSYKRPDDYCYLMEHSVHVEAAVIDALTQRFRGRVKDGHPLWSRLRGENSFCRKGAVDAGLSDRQAESPGKSGPRYNILNFCWQAHKTLECRVLPAFKMRTLAVEAVETVVLTLEKFLVEHHRITGRRRPLFAQELVVPRRPAAINWMPGTLGALQPAGAPAPSKVFGTLYVRMTKTGPRMVLKAENPMREAAKQALRNLPRCGYGCTCRRCVFKKVLARKTGVSLQPNTTRRLKVRGAEVAATFTEIVQTVRELVTG